MTTVGNKLLQIHVINNFLDLDESIERLKHSKVVGIDMEYIKQNKVALIQIATGNKIYIYQLRKLQKNRKNKLPRRIPINLAKFLQDENILKVGVGIKSDAIGLERTYGIELRNYLDLNRELKKREYNLTTNLYDLSERYTEFSKLKLQKTQPWNALNLPSEQVEYAAFDAWLSLQIYLYLQIYIYDFQHNLSYNLPPFLSSIFSLDDYLSDLYPAFLLSNNLYGYDTDNTNYN